MTAVISLHLPKTAGTAFASVLAEAWPQRMVADYDDEPLHNPRWKVFYRALCKRRGAVVPHGHVVHGHFLAQKYALVPNARYAVWLRDPVDRMRSHYDYWQREFDPGSAGRLHCQMMEQRWSFERFALGPELRNLYAFFLWRFPLTRFDFVGITEFYNQDLQCFAEKFGIALSENLAPLNVRPDAVPVVDLSLRHAIEQWHTKDVKLYRQALQWREAGRWSIKNTA